jgi:hypothetical protein
MPAMSGRTDPDGVSVTEKSRGYSASTDGPAADTAVHSRETPMPVEWVSTEPVRPTGGKNRDVPDVRKSLRTADDVERARGRELPHWLPMAGAAVIALVVLAAGLVYVVRLAQTSGPPPKPEKPPVEEVEGVPVRKGLNSQ